MNKKDIPLVKILLKDTGLNWKDAIRLILELTDRLPPHCPRKAEQMEEWREAIRLGAKVWKDGRETEETGKVIRESISERSHLRASTRADLLYLSRRFLRCNPEWEHKPLRGITTKECRMALERSFHTPSQLKKGRAFLHGIFSYGMRQEWCGENPVSRIGIPVIHEKEIHPLNPDEIGRLLHTAALPQHRDCAPALGLMLWNGIRPHEVKRLGKEDIDLKNGWIILRPRHTKTGGARLLPIRPALKRWLEAYPPSSLLCPPNWSEKWKRLRRGAGFRHWEKDVLRHTFASYHYRGHGDISMLQQEMGHRSPELLLTRYLNPNGLNPKACREFFRVSPAKKIVIPSPVHQATGQPSLQ